MGKNKDSSNPVWERRKNAILMSYRKMLKSKHRNPNALFKHKQEVKQEKKTFFQRAMEEYEKRKAERDKIKLIKETKRKEKEEALKRYKEKKREKFQKLCKKTKWGQPVMGGRMEILAERIEKNYASYHPK